MKKPVVVALALPVLFLLAACGGATPAPTPSETAGPFPSEVPVATGTPTPTPTPSAPEPPAEDVDAPVGLLVNSSIVSVIRADGTQISAIDYSGDAAAAAAVLAAALRATPVTTSAGEEGSCSTLQTQYDFGGIVLRSPGLVGSVGALEVEVTGSATTGGIPITTLGGLRIGDSRAAANAAIGAGIVDLGSSGVSDWIGFDRTNPSSEEFDAVGTIARFDSGVLVVYYSQHFFYGDC
jgi:hypothetical protein